MRAIVIAIRFIKRIRTEILIQEHAYAGQPDRLRLRAIAVREEFPQDIATFPDLGGFSRLIDVLLLGPALVGRPLQLSRLGALFFVP